MDPTHWSTEDDPLHTSSDDGLNLFRGVGWGLLLELAFVVLLIGCVWGGVWLDRWMFP